MKRIKRIAIMAIMFVYIFCISTSFVGCEIGLRLYETEYFIYTVTYENPRVGILGLTDKGKEQEYLVIPETIDGKKVTFISCDGDDVKKIKEKYGDMKYSCLQSENVKKVFVIPEIKVYNGSFFKCATHLEGVFYISNETKIQENINHYDYYYTEKNKMVDYGVRMHKANVSYCYNYENAPNNGYYWIDNYAYGEKIEYIPESPIRDGYTFDGWYKEPECINVWNFEVDILPQAEYGEEGYEVYQETKLYAKWIKK